MKIVLVVLLLTITILIVVSQNKAQDITKDNPLIIEDNVNACEINYLEFRKMAIESFNTNERIFIVFRAGDREGKITNNKRFGIIKRFMQKQLGYESEHFLYVIGEKVKGQGRIELYLGSKLNLVILAKRGRVPCIDCCGFDFNKGIF